MRCEKGVEEALPPLSGQSPQTPPGFLTSDLGLLIILAIRIAGILINIDNRLSYDLLLSRMLNNHCNSVSISWFYSTLLSGIRQNGLSHRPLPPNIILIKNHVNLAYLKSDSGRANVSSMLTEARLEQVTLLHALKNAGNAKSCSGCIDKTSGLPSELQTS
jgi:hypothetical protein